jgi:sterol desaturase/sphingolipid hydroxylase (fatty acid hydroxylase superfamily)
MQGLSLTVMVIAISFLVELFATGSKNASLFDMFRGPRNSTLTDIACFLCYGIGFFDATVFIGSFGLSAVVLHGVHLIFGHFFRTDVHLNFGNPGLNLAIYYVFTNFLSYWNHRIFHFGLFWNFHRIHYSATKMNPLVEHRNHPMQHALDGGLFALPLAVISVRPEYVALLAVANQFHQLIIHSNINSNWGLVGRWIFVSPLAHRIHHSVKPEHFNQNFSDGLIIWDRMFGTYCADFSNVGLIGVVGVEYNRYGVLYDMLADYGRAASDIGKTISRSLKMI